MCVGLVSTTLLMGCASWHPREWNARSLAFWKDRPAKAEVETGPDSSDLSERLQRISRDFHGALGYSLRHDNGDLIEYRAEELFPAASTIKLAILAEAMHQQMQGRMGYYETKVYEEKHKRGGAGFIQNYQLGTKLEFKELLHLMITVSDNTATAMMIDWLGTESVNGRLDALGLTDTRLLSGLENPTPKLAALREKFGLGVTTPREMRLLMDMIMSGEAAPDAAAADEMQRLLTHQYFDGMVIVEHPPSVVVLEKGGAISTSRSSVAHVSSSDGPYTFAVFTRDNQDTRWTKDNEAELAIARFARTTWRHYHPESGYRPPARIRDF